MVFHLKGFSAAMKSLRFPYHINGQRNSESCVRTNLGDPPRTLLNYDV